MYVFALKKLNLMPTHVDRAFLPTVEPDLIQRPSYPIYDNNVRRKTAHSFRGPFRQFVQTNATTIG